MFQKILSTATQDFGLTLTSRQLEQFEIFYKLIVEWNTKINLTAIVDAKDFAVKFSCKTRRIFEKSY